MDRLQKRLESSRLAYRSQLLSTAASDEYIKDLEAALAAATERELAICKALGGDESDLRDVVELAAVTYGGYRQLDESLDDQRKLTALLTEALSAEQTDRDRLQRENDALRAELGEVRGKLGRVRRWLDGRNLWHMEYCGQYSTCGSELEEILEED